MQDEFPRVLNNFQRVGKSRTKIMLEEEKIYQLQDRERSMRQLESEDLASMVQVDKETGLSKFTSKKEPDLMTMEMPSARLSMVSKIRSMQQSKGILTTVIRSNGVNCPEMKLEQRLLDMAGQECKHKPRDMRNHSNQSSMEDIVTTIAGEDKIKENWMKELIKRDQPSRENIVTTNAGEDMFEEMKEYIVTEHIDELIKRDQPSRENIVTTNGGKR